MYFLAKLCPASAWLRVSASFGGIVSIACGLVNDGAPVYYSPRSIKQAEKDFRRAFGLVGVRLRRVSA